MKTLLALAAVAIFSLGLSSCGGDTQESLMEDSIDKMEELADVCEGIKDEASAKAAVAKIETIGKATQKEFFVDAEPTGPGYLTLQTYGLEPSTLRVLLNGQLLPLAELPELKVQKTWTTWTEVIPGGFLVKGANTIRFETTGPKESLLVRDVILHWHEPAF